MANRQNIEGLTSKDIVQPSLLPEYYRRMGVFSDDLMIACTNLSILRQVQDFDADLFEAPEGFLSFLAMNLMDQVLLILTRLWGDRRRGVMTMDDFAVWLSKTGARTQ